MGWNNWSYWLRGGIIGAIILLILVIFDLVSGDNLFFIIPSLLVWSLGGGDTITQSTEKILTYIIFTLYGFIIGIILGWIVGKIKYKK